MPGAQLMMARNYQQSSLAYDHIDPGSVVDRPLAPKFAPDRCAVIVREPLLARRNTYVIRPRDWVECDGELGRRTGSLKDVIARLDRCPTIVRADAG
jgi:hypothetical protein